MQITLLTDFGDCDGHVGAMKGVIACRAPEARVVDIAHHVPPGDIHRAAHVLSVTAPFFPAGTCHVVVVDPGVGTNRRALAVAVDEQIYVAPDNGVLTSVLQSAAGRIGGVELTNAAFWQHPVSNTFHGRDIFAPVAAHLALGVPMSMLGRAVDPETLVKIELPTASLVDGVIQGCITYIDHFGNGVTSIPGSLISSLTTDAAALSVTVGEHEIGRLHKTYGSVEPGEPVALIGSYGRLEIALNSRSAAELLGLVPGAPVLVSVK